MEIRLGSDLSLRYKLFSRSSLEHPAKLHLGLVRWIVEKYTRPGDVICDPMAGIGSTAYAALLQRDVILREIEPKWLAISHENAALLIQSGGMFSGNINISQHDAREPWVKLEVEHVIPITLHGTNYIFNIQPLCHECNAKKHTKIEDYRNEIWLQGISVAQFHPLLSLYWAFNITQVEVFLRGFTS